MLAELGQIGGTAAYVTALVCAGLFCVAGVVLSCLSISGTWLVLAATMLVALVREQPFPGVSTIVAFIVIALAVEAAEALAGSIGVKRRGGSGMAAVLAVVGGLAGIPLGSFLIPLPVIGGLAGMLAGSFALVFFYERQRLKHAQTAASIAWGAVIAHVLVIVMKAVVTVGMAAWLWLGLIFF